MHRYCVALLYSTVTRKVLCANVPSVFRLARKYLPCVMRLTRNIFISGLGFGFGRDRAYDVIGFLMFRIRINNKDKYKKYLWNTKIDNTSNILHVANLQSFVVTSRKTSSCVLISIVHDSTTVHEIRRYKQ